MTTIVYPTDARRPSEVTPRIIFKNAQFDAGPFSSYQQGYARSGAQLGMILNYRQLSNADVQELIGLFLGLQGVENRIELEDWGYEAQGTYTGTPLIKGADQTGTTLETDGWTAGITLKRGNRFHFQNGNGHKELKIITADTVVDGSGNASIPIFPDIHTSPADNQALEIAAPVGTFKLVSNPFEWTDLPGNNHNFSVEFLESAP